MVGVKFGDKHSSEFGLWLEEKTIGLPPARAYTVDVPGLNGALDLSENLTGAITYQNRTLRFTFHVLGGRDMWQQRLTAISNYLHGKTMRICPDFDKNYFYYGRCTVDSMATDRITARITIVCDCKPYKTEIVKENWEWNPFSLVDGIIYGDSYTVNGTLTATVYNREMLSTPVFNSTAAMSVTLNGGTAFDIGVGTTTVYTDLMQPGENTIAFSGTGAVNLTFERGRL